MRARWIAARLALVASAGCARRPAPAPPATPAPIDVAALAAELAGELAELAAIVHAHRDDCAALAGAMRALFVRTRTSVATAHRAQLDDATAKRLVIELGAYDRVTAAYTAAIAADFTAAPACTRDREVVDVMRSMPTL